MILSYTRVCITGCVLLNLLIQTSFVLFYKSSGSFQNTRLGLQKVLMQQTKEIFEARFISLFLADAFAPMEYGGSNPKYINFELRRALKVSEEALLLSGASPEDISKMKACLERVQFKNNAIEDQEELILEQINFLQHATSFRDSTNSIIFNSGNMYHSCLLEIMRMNFDKDGQIVQNGGTSKLVFIFYNSGSGLEYHFKKNIDFKNRYSPVMIFTREHTSPTDKFLLNWLKFHFIFKKLNNLSMDFFYQVLFGHLTPLPFDDKIYKPFMKTNINHC